MDDDIIRIMLSTDNHLGFAEKDSVRCNDCFSSFEEVLLNAKKSKSDFILFAGDMFHENKPSRRTLHSTMKLLRKHCYGEDKTFVKITNEQSELFKTNFGKVNYEDPNQSISLPIFTIHGNHDDPSKEGGHGDSLAAMDLLSISNFVNYFGKADQVDDIEIHPILFSKNGTKIALYGLGAQRDERLNRMWSQKKVKFIRLTEEQGFDDYHNIFVLHQNRDYGRGRKNCVHESMIPEWMDLVVWGNEHECQPNLNESLVGTFRILQPGSSVSTSLNSTESSSCPKYMFRIDIRVKQMRMTKYPYRTLRQFVYGDISLSDFKELEVNHPKIEEKIKVFLTDRIKTMIREARDSISEPTPEEEEQLSTITFKIRDPLKVLIRLRVEHEGFPGINPQRFGQQFVGDVANPSDLLLLSKKKKEIVGGSGLGRSNSVRDNLKRFIQEGAEDEIHKIKIEDLVNETLANSKNNLSLLVESELALALDEYIVKKNTSAISDMIGSSLERAQRALKKDKTADDRYTIKRAAEKYKQEIEEKQEKASRDLNLSSSSNLNNQDMEVEEEEGNTKENKNNQKDSDFDDDDDDDEIPVRTKSTSSIDLLKNKTKSVKRSSEFLDLEESDDDFKESDQESVPVVTKGKGKKPTAKSTKTTAKKAVPAKKPAATPAGRGRTSKNTKVVETPGTSAVSKTRKSSRAAATKAKSYSLQDEDELEGSMDNESFDELPKKRKKTSASDDDVSVAELEEEIEDSEVEEVEESEDDFTGRTRKKTGKNTLKSTSSKAPKPIGKHIVQSAVAAKTKIQKPEEEEIEESDEESDDGFTGRSIGRKNVESVKSTVKASTSKSVTKDNMIGKKKVEDDSFVVSSKKEEIVDLIDSDDDDDGDVGFTSRSVLSQKPKNMKNSVAPTNNYTATVNESFAFTAETPVVVNKPDNENVCSNVKNDLFGTEVSTVSKAKAKPGAKKRQLPLSFSQVPASQSSAKRSQKNKSLLSGWDD